jgi:hypothetical protein
VSRIPGGRFPLLLAVLLPAAAAAALVLLLTRPSDREAPEQVPSGDAARLAMQAESAPELRPIVLRGDKTVLGTGPAASSDAGPGAGVPVRLSIPELHVDTSVEPVAATEEGIEVPAIGRAGWFDGGARPGDPGRAVIIGHLDGASGPGVFENVPSIKTGSQIVVVDEHDGVHRYAVTGKLQVPKAEFPADAVYGGSDSPVLVLVTCGGEYVEGAGYTDNVVIYARSV